MWSLKGCPKCGGDMFPDWEQHVHFETCLQCGYDRIQQSPDEKVDRDVQKQAEEKALASAIP